MGLRTGPLCLASPSSVSQVKFNRQNRVSVLQLRDQTHGLGIVIKPAFILQTFPQSILARMSERRVPHIMRQGQRLGQIFINAELARDGAGDLGDFERMGQSVRKKSPS